MEQEVKRALDKALTNWKSMSNPDGDEPEAAADQFESSFYLFIDALRDWFNELDQQPLTLEEFMELPLIEDILERLPAPLYLNFETEAELIIENIRREDEEKYD